MTLQYMLGSGAWQSYPKAVPGTFLPRSLHIYSPWPSHILIFRSNNVYRCDKNLLCQGRDLRHDVQVHSMSVAHESCRIYLYDRPKLQAFMTVKCAWIKTSILLADPYPFALIHRRSFPPIGSLIGYTD